MDNALRISAVKKGEKNTKKRKKQHQIKNDENAISFQDSLERAETAKVASMLDYNDSGKPLNSMYNVAYIIRNDAKLKNKIRYNSFAQALEPKPGIHWRGTWDETITHELWSDDDTAALNVYMGTTYKVSNKSALEDMLTAVGKENSYHPVRDYLNNLEWDGTPRVETFFHKILGAEDSEVNREITKMFFKGAVARPMKPGIKFDYALTLFGDQGIGKSYIFDRLARKWFTSTVIDMGSKDSYLGNLGSWITEYAEGASSKKIDIETMKAFITAREDKVRMPYGRRFSHLKRQGVMVITTNDEKYFKDTGGNRRFPIIEVGVENIEDDYIVASLTEEYIDQIWAEAVQIYEEDPVLVFSDDIKKQVDKVVAHHTDWEISLEELDRFLKKPITKDWYRRPWESRVEDMNQPDEDESWARPHAKVKRKYICVADIVEEYLRKPDWKVWKNADYKNKAAFKRITEQLKQTPGVRKAAKKHGDPETKNFGVYGTHRTYFVIEDLD